jgi:hypothetical protein
MYYLELETPEGTKRIQLTRDRLSIGRLSYNDVALPSSQISRQHAELRLINGEWWIADRHSTNGLHLNAQRIQEHRLVPGDCIVLAPGISIRFLSDSPHELPVQRPATPLGRAGSGDAFPLLGLPVARPARAPLPTPPLAPPGDAGWSSPSSADRERNIERPAMSSDRGYPAPSGPMSAGSGLHDPYRRSFPANDQHRPTAGPMQKLLHVCQTCGQLTAPDAVYCQNCHQSIAYECPNCRLSLLPIQERCPRCQTPNPGSVRRAHRNTSA